MSVLVERRRASATLKRKEGRAVGADREASRARSEARRPHQSKDRTMGAHAPVANLQAGCVDNADKENGLATSLTPLKSPRGAKRMSTDAFKSPLGNKRKKPFEVLTDSVLNSPRPNAEVGQLKPLKPASMVVEEENEQQDNDNTTTDSILATRKSKRRKSMARRVSFAPDHSLNKLCVYERDGEEYDGGDDEEVKSKRSGKAKSLFGFDTSNMFSALQSPSGSELTASSVGASLKSPESVAEGDAVHEASSKKVSEDPRALQQLPVPSLDDTGSLDGGIKVVMNLQDDDTVGITLTGDLTGSLPRLSDLVQDDETNGSTGPMAEAASPLPVSREEEGANITSQSTDLLPTNTIESLPGDTLDCLQNVNEREGGDTTNLYADAATDDVDMDVTGKLPNLSTLVDVDEAQDEPKGDAFDSPEILSAVNDLGDADVTMDLTENITMNLPDLSNLVQEDEGLKEKEVENTPLKCSTDQQHGLASGSSTKNERASGIPEHVEAALTSDTLSQDQKQRWGFEPGAVDTLEMDLTQNGANLMGEKTFHAVYRHSMGLATTASVAQVNRDQQQEDCQAGEPESAHVLSFQEFLQEADVQFLDFLRRGTSFGAANMLKNEEPKELMECMELLYLTGTELCFLEKGCAILQEDCRQRKFQIADKERYAEENQPDIFREIQEATGEKLVNLKFDLQQLKRVCRVQTSQAWKDWRMKIELFPLEHFVRTRGVLEKDLVSLEENGAYLRDSLLSGARSLTDHVQGQVALLIKEASGLKASEALALELESTQGRLDVLENAEAEGEAQCRELEKTKEALLRELKEVEDQVEQAKGAQPSPAHSPAPGAEAVPNLDSLVATWDMMVSLAGDGLKPVLGLMKEKRGKLHLSESQSILRQGFKKMEECNLYM